MSAGQSSPSRRRSGARRPRDLGERSDSHRADPIEGRGRRGSLQPLRTRARRAAMQSAKELDRRATTHVEGLMRRAALAFVLVGCAGASPHPTTDPPAGALPPPSTDPLACATDAECTLVARSCCSCGSWTAAMVEPIRVDRAQARSHELCRPEAAVCPACLAYPVDPWLRAVCRTGRCDIFTRHAVGEPCADSSDCEATLVCADSRQSDTTRTRVCVLPCPSGVPWRGRCPLAPPYEGAFCERGPDFDAFDAPLICYRGGYIALGGSCATQGQCITGAACGSNQRCEPACNTTADCSEGIACETVSGACVP